MLGKQYSVKYINALKIYLLFKLMYIDIFIFIQ